jgi:hypothetical protein
MCRCANEEIGDRHCEEGFLPRRGNLLEFENEVLI